MKKAVIYVRCCSNKNAAEQIEKQLMICRKFAADNDFCIVKEYKDVGMSGTNVNRPAYLQLVADSKSGEWDTIIVKGLERIARSSNVLIDEINKFSEKGIKIVSPAIGKTDIDCLWAISSALK